MTLLYSRNKYIVNQPYFNKIKKTIKTSLSAWKQTYEYDLALFIFPTG